jgi:hypothetical protein
VAGNFAATSTTSITYRLRIAYGCGGHHTRLRIIATVRYHLYRIGPGDQATDGEGLHMSRPTGLSNTNAGSVANTTDADTGSHNTIDAVGSKLAPACAFHGPTCISKGGIVGSTTFRGMQPQRDKWAVAVYYASGPTSPDLLALATHVDVAIADCGWTVVSGGGRLSAMGADPASISLNKRLHRRSQLAAR